MKKQFSAKAYAKVNLQLDVTGTRPDGCHELAGVMQRISLYDPVSVAVSPAPARRKPRISVAFDVPVPFRNTVRTAAELYLGSAPYSVDIKIEKRIPSEAGLGGASADAAAVLCALNTHFAGTPLERSLPELYSLGLAVGADVPFCLMGGCAVARGVGENLTPLPHLPMTLVVIKGEKGVSTPRLFGLFDELQPGASGSRLPEGALENAVAAIKTGDLNSLGKAMLNALQPAALSLVPEIADELSLLTRFGALGACMTGSGSAVVGLFESEAAALPLIAHLDDTKPAGLFYALCRSEE